jgi:site-specific DNA-methyltransferase (adenine-specific)
VITDSPFSARTAKGYKTNPAWQSGSLGDQNGIAYGSITEGDVLEVVESWAPRTRYWIVAFGDHVSIGWWERALVAVGWYTFAPVAYVKRGAPPRFLGDGPASQVEWIMVGRPRSNRYKERRGSRPGWYLAGRGDAAVTGAKDIRAMRRIVRDYAAPGDLIADPFAGSATTLLAAALEGRRSVGAEVDPVTHAAGIRRLHPGHPDQIGLALNHETGAST